MRLFDIDSFQVPESEQLRHLREQAEQTLEQQVREFLTWYDCRDMIPAIKELSRRFGEDSLSRMEPAVRRLGLEDADAQRLRGQVSDMARKQFCRLLFAVRDEAGAAAFRQCLDAVEKLYESSGAGPA